MATKAKRKTKVFLTPKQKSEVIRLKGAGTPIDELAAVYNVHPNTIKSICKGGKTRKPRVLVTSAMADEILELRAAGMTFDKIASMMNIGHATVSRHLKKLGDPLKAKYLENKPLPSAKPEGTHHPAGMIYTDEGPELPPVSKRGDDFMDGIKLTLGIAAVLGLFILALGQAGVL
jgi:DNA-binding transcriptional ArsR family regulator